MSLYRIILFTCMVQTALSVEAGLLKHHSHSHSHSNSHSHSHSNSHLESQSHSPSHPHHSHARHQPALLENGAGLNEKQSVAEDPDRISLLETFAGAESALQVRAMAKSKQTVSERSMQTAPSLASTPVDLTQATMRLVGGETPNSGRVEVLHNNVWGTICDDGFNQADGDVVCRQLGLGEAVSVSCCGAFGQGTGTIWLSNLACTGKEVRLADCLGTSWGATGTCTHAEDAGVTCSAVDCQVSEYDLPTPCSAACGGGVTHRVRHIVVKPTPEGRPCPAQMDVSTPCNTQNCPVDCVVGPWGAWDTCSFTCGGGTQTRTRSVTTEPLDGGAVCPSLTDTQLCNTQDCPLDCVAGEWSNWGECDKACGVGERSRNRVVVSASQFGGRDCGMLSMKQACNTIACPVDCTMRPWSVWSACDSQCGNGTQTRTREVATFNNVAGAACPPTLDSQLCNTDPCPIDCIMSEWGDWDACDRTCGNGIQYRSRTITQPAMFSGVPCGPTSMSQACNQEPCRMDYIRNLIDRVRRLELQNRVAKLEQLQAQLAGLAARERAQEIIDQANSMKDAAAPFYIPVSVPPVVDQSSASVFTPTVNPFPQAPIPSSSSALPVSSSAAVSTASGSSSGVSPAQLVSLYEKLDPFPSPLLLETEESQKGHAQSTKHHRLHSLTDMMKHTKSGKSRASQPQDNSGLFALLPVAADPAMDTQTRQNAMLAFAELVESAFKEDEKALSQQRRSKIKF